MVERLDAGLQQQVCPTLGPLHRLTFYKPFAEHGVDRGLYKRRRNCLSASIPLAIVGNEGPIGCDIRTELLHGSFELGETRVDVHKVVNGPVEVPQSANGFGYLPMP